MTPLALLDDLRRRGVRVWPAGDKLRFAPKSAVPPDLREAIASHKSALLLLLAGDPWIAPDWADRIDPATGLPLRWLDPRPDLHEDHALWVRVLAAAWQDGQELHGLLHGLRCGGARLEMLPYPGPYWEPPTNSLSTRTLSVPRLVLDITSLMQPFGEEEGEALRRRWLAPMRDRIDRVLRVVQRQGAN